MAGTRGRASAPASGLGVFGRACAARRAGGYAKNSSSGASGRPHRPSQRLRPFPLHCVPTGPRLCCAPNVEDFAAARRGHAAKIAPLREAPTRQPSQNPPCPPGAETTPGAAPFMLSAAPRQTGFVFGFSHASEVRRGCLAASGVVFGRSLPRGLERAGEFPGSASPSRKSRATIGRACAQTRARVRCAPTLALDVFGRNIAHACWREKITLHVPTQKMPVHRRGFPGQPGRAEIPPRGSDPPTSATTAGRSSHLPTKRGPRGRTRYGKAGARN